MSFRPFNLDVRHGAVLGAFLLGAVWASRGGDPIEVVPFRGSVSVDTNFDHARVSDKQDLEAMYPRAARTFHAPQPGAVMLPPQRPPTATSGEQEKELQDRRRNWVFMTPEDLAKSSGEKDWDSGIDKGQDGKSTTAMERYYQHLYDLDRSSATNDLGVLKPDRASWATNSSWSDVGKGDSGFVSSPFDTSPDPGIFQPSKGSDFSTAFAPDKDAGLPSPETVRAQAEQKARMDSFKELWDMSAPAGAAAATPAPVAASSGASFNSQQSLQPSFNAFSPAGASVSSSPLQPVQPTVTSMRRNSGPPHSDFAPPQNPF